MAHHRRLWLAGGADDGRGKYCNGCRRRDVTSRVDAFTSEHWRNIRGGRREQARVHHPAEYSRRATRTSSSTPLYTSMVEAYIEQQLGASVASFDMQSFCATLSERVASDESLLDHPALEMLFAYSDFEAFKALMLSTRKAPPSRRRAACCA